MSRRCTIALSGPIYRVRDGLTLGERFWIIKRVSVKEKRVLISYKPVLLSPLFLLTPHFLTLPIRLSKAVRVCGIETGPFEGAIEVSATADSTSGGRS